MPREQRRGDFARRHLIVEVEGYDGESGRIVVENDRANGSPRFGAPDKIYCIAALEPDGVVRLHDWGYATVDEARAALDAEVREITRESGSP